MSVPLTTSYTVVPGPTPSFFVDGTPPELNPLHPDPLSVHTPWVIACTNPRSEKQLVRYILRHFHTLPYALPYTARRSSSSNLHHSPLLPGFVFVACPPSSPSALLIPPPPLTHPIDQDEYNLQLAALCSILTSSHMVHSFIRPTARYQPQLRQEIALLTPPHSSPENRRLARATHIPNPGARVRIHSGPLMGMQGVVDTFSPAPQPTTPSDPQKVNLILRLEILGTSASVQIPLSLLEVI